MVRWTADLPASGRRTSNHGPKRLPTSKPTESPAITHRTTTTHINARSTRPSPARTPPTTAAVSPGMKNPTINAASAKTNAPMTA